VLRGLEAKSFVLEPNVEEKRGDVRGGTIFTRQDGRRRFATRGEGFFLLGWIRLNEEKMGAQKRIGQRRAHKTTVKERGGFLSRKGCPLIAWKDVHKPPNTN